MAATLPLTSSPSRLEGERPTNFSIDPLARRRGQSRGAAILSDDSLTTYMNQIRQTEVLPEEEQDRLARAYVNDGDIEAGKTLIWTNLRLVISIAKKFHRDQDLMELIQEGNLGLSEALIRFDPDKGTPFVGYAHFWIRAMILNHLLNLSHPVRLGNSRDSRKLFFNLKKARRKLLREGQEPTAENVAQYLDVDPDEVVRVSTIMDGGVVYLDAPTFGEEDSPSRIDLMPTDADSPDDTVQEQLFREKVAQLAQDFVETLPDERRATIWRERMIAVEPRYLKDLGAQYDVSKERIRQLEMDIRSRFRRFIQHEIGDDVKDYLSY